MNGVQDPFGNKHTSIQRTMAASRRPVPLFLHIPKSGGTTLSDWIFEQVKTIGTSKEEGRWFKSGVFFYPSGFVRGPYPRDLPVIQRTLRSPELRAVVGHFYFGLHEQLKMPSRYVTLLREPIDRLISLYHFQKLVQSKQGTHQGVEIPEYMTLREFVESVPYSEIDNGQTRRIAGVGPTYKRCPAAALDTAKENIDSSFDVAGVLEKFDEALVLMCQEFGWNRASLCFRKNINPHRNSSSSIPDDTRDFIITRNELDVSLYEYVRKKFQATIIQKGDRFKDAVCQFKNEQKLIYQNILNRQRTEVRGT